MSHETTKLGAADIYLQFSEVQGLAGSSLVTFHVLSPSILHVEEKEIARLWQCAIVFAVARISHLNFAYCSGLTLKLSSLT